MCGNRSQSVYMPKKQLQEADTLSFVWKLCSNTDLLAIVHEIFNLGSTVCLVLNRFPLASDRQTLLNQDML